jgi:uncharacterized protein (TIGR02466 family)
VSLKHAAGPPFGTGRRHRGKAQAHERKKYRLGHAWANANRQGNFNVMHTHPGSTWSGTYYVDTGVEEPTTAKVAPLYLLDPCMARATTFLPTLLLSSFTVRPEPGLMVMFPSYLAHMVFPQEANGARISIAFNLRREPFP